MFLTPKNDLLYDSKNFDKYNNMFTIITNKKKKDQYYKIIENQDNKLHTTYYKKTEMLKLYFLFEEIDELTGVHKIIYGHYYNNHNMFLFKYTKYKYKNKNEIIFTCEIHKCPNQSLMHNDSNKLICSSSYVNIQKQLGTILNNDLNKFKLTYKENYPLGINYNNEILNIKSNNKFSSEIENENLKIFIN